MNAPLKPRDSSKTRVVPVLSLASRHRGWVQRIIETAEDAFPCSVARSTSHADPVSEDCKWGGTEQALYAPTSLLEWLVQNLKPPLSGDWGSESAGAKRRLLVGRHAPTIDEALRSIRGGNRAQTWPILEGPSFPDVFIETPEYVLVAEGKRTEAGPTTTTTWMPTRHQMWRHMDAAWDILGTRRLVGLMIVEGDGPGEVPANWKTAVRALLSDAALAESLPHRDQATREAIRCSFAGVTTWQRLIREFGEDPGTLPNTVDDVPAWCAARGIGS